MSTQKPKRRRGRPPLAPEVAQLALLLPRHMLRAVDDFAADELLRRSEAVRRLIERGLRSERAAA